MSDHVLPRYTKPHVKISHGFVNVGKALIPREAVVHVYEFVACKSRSDLQTLSYVFTM